MCGESQKGYRPFGRVRQSLAVITDQCHERGAEDSTKMGVEFCDREKRWEICAG